MTNSSIMCNYCTYSETDPQITCTVCFDRLCKSLGTNQTRRSICHTCIHSMNVNNSFQYDGYGRALDPTTRHPLPTCTCGKVVDMCPTPCRISWMGHTTGGGCGDDGHKPVIVSRV